MRQELLNLTSLIINFLMPIYSQSSEANEYILLDYLFDHIENDLSPHRVNVIAEDFDQLSHLGKKIVQKANAYVASSNYDYKTIEKMKQIDIHSQPYDNLIRHTPEGLSLMFGIIEMKSRSNLLKNIRTMLTYSSKMNPWFRGKLVINIIKNEDIDLEHFFQSVWSWDFIDVTMIEWNQINSTNKSMRNSTIRNMDDVFVYSYDSSNGNIRRQILTAQMEPFLKVLKNFGEYPLLVKEYEKSDEIDIPEEISLDILNISLGYKRDMPLLLSLIEAMNCSLRIYKKKNGDKYEPKSYNTWLSSQIDLPFNDWMDQFDRDVEDALYMGQVYTEYRSSIYMPRFTKLWMYLRRRKVYERSISFTSIMIFSVFIYTAWIFAIWARLLGFRERNWNFLNILTAQMGGSIKHDGPMKRSEMIFQISIYVATLIIATYGSDYMYQIFLMHQKLPKIETFRNLAETGIELVMDTYQYPFFHVLLKNEILEKIENRIQHRRLISGSNLFCFNKNPTAVVDDIINLCISLSKSPEYILKSDHEWQVDKIENPIHILMPSIELNDDSILFIKTRMEELITRFSETGHLDSWWKNFNSPNISNGIDNSLKPKLQKDDDEVPLESQLWPVLLVGYSVGFVVLIGELIWRYYIGKTKFVKLLKSFYQYAHSSPKNPQIRKNNLFLTIQKRRTVQIQEYPATQKFARIDHFCRSA
ncbi:hypothetical protein QAD02_004941 [Eretmocerus hayati]|uniref:Uncharacterized protein n=1 Tax=Eretmocerus hayati TaxID=131215 RepID=A0ACC2NRF0_9HYME|nr:hypothetical protein QAD02_004941 [Eretmocerus hayati]